MQRVPRRCCLSLAKQQSSLSHPLCFRHSSKVGSKTKLLNQKLGSTPGFQARAVKGPLCPLQSFMGTADSRSEAAFQACLYQSNLLLHSGGASWRGFSPPGCAGTRGLGGAHPPPAGLRAARLSLHAASWLSSSTSLPLLAGLRFLTPVSTYGKIRYLSGEEIKPLSALLHSFHFIGRLFLSCLLCKRHYNNN